jgi:hypothetical protein
MPTNDLNELGCFDGGMDSGFGNTGFGNGVEEGTYYEGFSPDQYYDGDRRMSVLDSR